jgi:AcrR family transcriptional regulator
MTQLAKPTKSDETRRLILDSALALFREKGFDAATMRDVAAKAGLATGAAYYYFPSKEAIVLGFYERSAAEMHAELEAVVAKSRGLEQSLSDLIQVKLDAFAPNRNVLRALLRNGADRAHPLSPFSKQTKPIRDADIEWFRKIVTQSNLRLPRDLEPHLPETLWMFQMGVIFFWVTDDSPTQERTARLLELSSKTVTALLRFTALPLTRPLRKVAIELIELIKRDGQ